jgi:hypothetical protein
MITNSTIFAVSILILSHSPETNSDVSIRCRMRRFIPINRNILKRPK